MLPATAIDPRRAARYAPLVLAEVPRLIGNLDREPQSRSYGSFNRTHWSWKFCDFPVMMPQIAAYPLALLWRHPFDSAYCGNARLLEWIHGAVTYVCAQQRRNGSYDSVGPFTQDHGNTMFMTYLLTEVRALLGSSMDDKLAARVDAAVAAGAGFGLRSHEDYAFISNHQALYALAFRNAASLTNDSRFAARAAANIERILGHQSTEGWYEEYGGSDPGYETLGLFYLATYWQRQPDAALLDSLTRSVGFLSHFVHPDGGLGGAYASRHTSLYMPGGLEILSASVPDAAAVAEFIGARLGSGAVVTPQTTDAENLGVISYTYLAACLAPPSGAPAPPPLPLQRLDGIERFPKSGLTVVGTPAYYAVVNVSKGGVCRAFDKSSGQMSYEDAGYVADINGRRYASQLAGMSQAGEIGDPHQIASTGRFAEVRQALPTPLNWIVLRIANLTLFRSLALGAWVRRKILARLILGRTPGPLELTRTIAWDATGFRIQDQLAALDGAQLDALVLARSFTAIHMGSAKYFHPADLAAVESPVDGERLRAELNARRSATAEFAVRLGR